MKKSLLAIIFSALAIVACSKKEPEPAPTPAPAPAVEKPAEVAPEPTPAPEPAAEVTPAQDISPEPAAEAPTEVAPEPAPAPEPAAATTLPAECEAYLAKVNACVEKLGAAGDAVKQGLETTRESWKQVPQESLGEACKQASEMFEQQAGKAMGC